jgi:hypothetical protein
MANRNKINSRVDYTNGNIQTETRDLANGLHVEIESRARGRKGTQATIGFESAPNRYMRLDGRDLRQLYTTLQRHFSHIEG